MSNTDQTEQLPPWAIVQKDGECVSIIPHISVGKMSADCLNAVNDVVQEFNLPGVRVTGRQRIQIQGIPKLIEVVDRLGPYAKFSKYFVGACPGNVTCRLGVQDSMAMAARLEDFLTEFTFPWKLKSSVSGCSMSCSESYVRDVGLVAMKKGWNVMFGGNAGRGVRKADALAEGVGDGEALKIIGKALEFYIDNAKKRERTSKFVERVGIEAVRDAIFGDGRN